MNHCVKYKYRHITSLFIYHINQNHSYISPVKKHDLPVWDHTDLVTDSSIKKNRIDVSEDLDVKC